MNRSNLLGCITKLGESGAFLFDSVGTKFAILDTDLVEKVTQDPHSYVGYTFICPANLFLQYPPYYNRYSLAVGNLVRVHRHLGCRFLLLEHGGYRVTDRRILDFVTPVQVVSSEDVSREYKI